MRRGSVLVGLVVAATPAAADSLSVTKTAVVVSDQVNAVNFKSLPGAAVDYRLLVTNPLANLAKPVRNIVIEDALPANVVLRVSDLVTGKGPVEFTDGVNVIGLGLLTSGMTCVFVSLGSQADCIDFNDGTSWGYVPQPDANGFDATVRKIRVMPVTTFTTGGSFQLRFRVKIR